MKFIINGRPQGKARARTVRNKYTGKVHSYTPENTGDYEDLIRWSYKQAGGEYYGDRLIAVTINAFYPIPKSYSKKKKMACISREIRPTTKPDLDNLIKAILDALNGVAYYDDNQVVSLLVNKYYGERGYVLVAVEPLEV